MYRPCYTLMLYERHTVDSQVAIFPCISRRHLRVLVNAKKQINRTLIASQVPENASITLKLQKCALFTNMIDYLGHISLSGWIDIANDTANAVRKRKAPTTVTGLRSLLAISSVFRSLVPNLARISSALSRSFKKTEANDLEPLEKDELLALDTPKKNSIWLPVLSLPKQIGLYTLDTDAGDEQVKRALLQVHKNRKAPRPIRYQSQNLTEREQNLATSHCKCLAVIRAILL